LPLCRLDRPEWVDEQEQHPVLPLFQERLAANTLQEGLPLFWQAGGFKVAALDRADPATYLWLDPSGPELLAPANDTHVWSVAWTDGGVVMPVALLVPGSSGRPARIAHLLPGGPSDVLATQV